MNVKATLRDMVQACKSKTDESLLRSHSLTSVTQTKAVYREHHQSPKILKRKDRGPQSAGMSYESLKIVFDPTPFYIYYAGSPTVATISHRDSSFSNDVSSPVDSLNTSVRAKDVAGPSKLRTRPAPSSAGASVELGSVDDGAEEPAAPDVFRGSPAFSVISGNVVGTSSINAPLFSKMGRLFRKPEGPTLTPTEFLHVFRRVC